MSLFDDDFESSSSCEVSDERVMESGRSDVRMDCLSGNMTGEVVGSTFPLISRCDCGLRFTLTSEEMKRAEERRRTEVGVRTLLHGGRLPAVGSTGGESVRGQSRFHASISEALQLRKETREKLLLQRIRKQREDEANNEELVEKDLNVGVFVTPQYVEALRRHRSSQGLPKTDSRGGQAAGEDYDDDDPLAAFVEGLEEKRLALGLPSSSTAATTVISSDDSSNYYDAKMMMHVKQQSTGCSNQQIEVPVEIQHAGGQTESLVLSHATVSVTPSCENPVDESSVDCTAKMPPPPVSPKSAVCSEDVLREARESRKRRRADYHLMLAAAKRFNTRALERLDVR